MRVGPLLSLLFVPGLALGASFNCSRATTPQERAICASQKLSAADDRMAATYAKALAATPPQWADMVRGDQRAWLKLVPLYCPVHGRHEGQSMAECLDNVYADRQKKLGHLVVRKAGVTFVSRSITLTVKEEDGDSPAPSQFMLGYGTLSASWQIATSDTPEWKAWNKTIESAVRQQAAHEDQSAQSSQPELQAEPFADVEITATVEAINGNLVTALVERWSWRGAHPNEYSSQLNWLLRDHRELQPEDVFRHDSGWAEILYKRCDTDLHHQLDPELGQDYTSWLEPGEVAKALHSTVSDSQNWKLVSRGIEIIYQDYAVAPHAAHPGPTLIPWAELKPYLQPAFTPPKTSAPPN